MIRVIGLLLVVLLGSPSGAGIDEASRAAVGAAQWIAASEIQTKNGIVWPADPADAKSIDTTLYAGTPGPILFFLELYRTTGDANYLASARRGADALLASMPDQREAGLYDGVAGTGFTLGQTYLVTQDERYRDGALHALRWLKEHAQHVGRGVQWNDTTDIIAGSSGIGLFLLWADRKLGASDAADLAVAAAKRLIERARLEAPGRMKWMMDLTFPNEMPNFSHGTAGVAYFLATVYQRTRDGQFLDAALAGARYLVSIADTRGDACLIYHDGSPAGKAIYYLSWCHGPAGTARLFYRLYEATNDRQWLDWTTKSARALVASGGPERAVTPGDWDNLGACCGVAAEGAFFLAMHRITGEQQYLELATKATTYLLSKAVRDDRGVRWVQAEHRVKPELRVAQTGYMQGASGIGMWLLHVSNPAKDAIVLPDNPFPF
jgi:lantibiotic modifying enzyme